MLNDNEVKLISLCSPRKRQQAMDAIHSMRAEKHVYAEKPCAISGEELVEIIKTSKEAGMLFHEMAGIAFEQPYLSIREVILAGYIGEVVQVFVQKFYPYFDGRPQDEGIDGCLT